MPYFSNYGPENAKDIRKCVSGLKWKWEIVISAYLHQDPHNCTKQKHSFNQFYT